MKSSVIEIRVRLDADVERFSLDPLHTVGFAEVDVLHKNGCFATFGAVKRGSAA